ncbi:hypothetical protein E2C01_001192 [Portunus trituberculatus]|uniref:Uncharacterized protein n=1 Tax=Portunus trituberculatus TaxID=210409 RepID=A0A5B7CLY2_PORTR|nr:hypothetical protein [Portunus trituberculatus]
MIVCLCVCVGGGRAAGAGVKATRSRSFLQLCFELLRLLQDRGSTYLAVSIYVIIRDQHMSPSYHRMHCRIDVKEIHPRHN